MKKIIIIFTILGLFLTLTRQKAKNDFRNGEILPTPSPVVKTISYGGTTYTYNILKADSEAILISNYNEQHNVSDIITQNNCKRGINGGFYDKNNKPLGLTVIEYKEISKEKDSSLFNGYLSLTKKKWGISVNSSGFEYALQTGPILVYEGNLRVLKINNDKNARRMFAAMDNLGGMYFGTVYLNDVPVLGPYLQDFPNIIIDIARKEGLGWQKAINLDGGRASAYLNGDLFLAESNPVGSWWCFTAK